MIYVYTAMLLHKAEKPVDEASVKKVVEAVGVTPDEGRIKALVAALDGVDIEAAIKEAAVAAPVAAAVAAPAEGSAPAEEKKEEEKKDEGQAAAGLGALFG